MTGKGFAVEVVAKVRLEGCREFFYKSKEWKERTVEALRRSLKTWQSTGHSCSNGKISREAQHSWEYGEP